MLFLDAFVEPAAVSEYHASVRIGPSPRSDAQDRSASKFVGREFKSYSWPFAAVRPWARTLTFRASITASGA